jgi:hypothetical protein
MSEEGLSNRFNKMDPVGLPFLPSVTSVLVFSSDLSTGDLFPLRSLVR